MSAADGYDQDQETSSGLSWGMGSFLFEKAFGDLAAGLRWMFWGLLLWLGGVSILGVAALGFKRAPGLLFLLPIGLIAWGIGGLVIVWGEQRCLHLKLPLGMTKSLPGHAWLRAAYACHLASILIRFFGRGFLPKAASGPLTVLLPLVGCFFLLLFLRKLADVIARTDLRRLIDVVFGLAAVVLFCGLVFTAGWQLRPAPPMRAMICGVSFGLATLTFLAVTACYVVLLWRMATAVKGFAEYLAIGPVPTDDSDLADQSVSA